MSLFNNVEKPIGLASDHAGFEAKQYLLGVLKEQGIPYKDFGTYSGEAVDYADYAHPMAFSQFSEIMTIGPIQRPSDGAWRMQAFPCSRMRQSDWEGLRLSA